MNEETKKAVLIAQKNEITEHHIYTRLAQSTKDEHNSDVLRQIGEDELRHYRFWKKVTGEDLEPNRLKVWWFLLISRIFGLTFGLRLMEAGEHEAHEVAYARLAQAIPGVHAIAEDEMHHEEKLIELVDEERLQYVGSMVLGLNDALVELTGTLAGLTFALQNTRLIAMAGLITGIAASLSMAASEYLSTKSEEGGQDPLKAALYTGTAYVVAVIILVLPYFLFPSFYLALLFTILGALVLILAFNYYIAVAKQLHFKERFLEMAGISLGVAAISFIIGLFVRTVLGVDV